MDNINSRIEQIKIFYFGEERGNHKKFCDIVGVASNTASNWMKDGYSIGMSVTSQIMEAFPSINSKWLLTGEGEMLIDTNPKQEDIQPNQENILSKLEKTPDNSTYKLVPVIHIDSVGGIHSNNDIEGEPQFIEGYVPFVNAKDGDRAIYQSGNSMIPTIPPGSLMQIREMPRWREYFGYGNIFIIELSDGRRITKEVARYSENHKEYIWCISHNPDVADEELPKSMIVSVWKVIKILTDKGW